MRLHDLDHRTMNVLGEVKRTKTKVARQRYKTQKIKDDLAGLNISRQRKYQLRKKRQGLCTICGKETFEGLVLCYEHMLKRGVHDPGKNRRLSLETRGRQEQAKGERWEFFLDQEKRWRWSKSANETIIASSVCGFFTRQACARNARRNGYPGK